MTQTDPFWWTDAGPPTAPPEQPLPTEIDALIIGGGLTGLSAALTLAKAGRAVLVLDAGAPGIGASSRNGGMIGGGHRLSIDEMTARFGRDTAVSLLREAHLDAQALALDVMQREGIDCDYQNSGRFRGLWHARDWDEAARGLDRLQQLIPLEAGMVRKEHQHEEVATDLYEGGVVFPQHGGLNPAKWVGGLMRAATAAGAQVQGYTPVIGVHRDGSAHQITTPRGSIRAGTVLAATNGYTPAHLSHLKRRIVPLPSFIVATEPLGANRMRSLFPKGRMIVENRERHCYYRPSPDGTRIVFGGRAAMTGVPDDFARREIKGLLRQIFPDLGDVALSHSWRGRTGFTFDTLPNVGCVNGIWHAMGYSGSGNAMAPYLGHKAALQILGDPSGETAFTKTGFPLRWWHQGRPWFLPFADLLFRWRDVRNNLAKRTS